ncbi:MAG TPA: acetylornithine deacetylase, partial [Xanthomonadales bacterium]|nr:acetylornithine deacetylase [Xanthomonadales bacterium]
MRDDAGIIAAILEHLRVLVAFDTRNPPRAIGADGGIVAYLRDALPGFRVDVRDHGAGAVSLHAVRGAPTRVFNFHIDTVPAADGWTRDPHVLAVEGGCAIGLGACDIKGAAAAMLAVASRTRGDLALLFSSDEEANDARCIRAFLAQPHGYDSAIVAEPTGAQAVLAHRGIVSAQARFAGVAGHASEARALRDNAIHRAVAWGAEALVHARALDAQSFGELAGFRFNLGRIEGGIKGNVIAPSCELRFGFRPLPSQSVDELIALFRDIAPPAHLESYEELFRGPPLPAGKGEHAVAQLKAGREL